MYAKLQAKDPGWLLGAAVAIAACSWLRPLGSGLWLDETLVRAMIHAPLQDLFWRPNPWSQSTLFNIIEWLAFHALPGSPEIRLRLVSVLGSVVAAVGVFWIGRKFVDRQAGLLSVIFFLILPSISEQACNARPYALAMCTEIWGLYFFLDALATETRRSLLLWAVFSITGIYLHIFFAFAFFIEAAFISAVCLHDRQFRRLKRFFPAGVLVFAGMVPLAQQVNLVWNERATLAIAGPVTVLNALFFIVPFVFIPAATAVASKGLRTELRPLPDARLLGLLTAILVVPLLTLFVLSRTSGTFLFLPRYLAVTLPACAIVWGILLSRVQTQGVRYSAVALGLLIACAALGMPAKQPTGANEDWRLAALQIPKGSGVLLYSGLVEARRLNWLDDASRWKYLSAPLTVYREDVNPAQTLLLPFSCDPAGRAYIDARLDRLLAAHEAITLEVRGLFSGEDWVRAIIADLTRRGMEPSRIGQYGNVRLIIFRPRASLARVRPPAR